MGCYTCGGNPNTWCTKCMPAEDTWVAPVDSLPDVFMGDRDHMYLLPNGDLFILSPDRTRWIKVNGTGNTTAYDDTELKKRLTALEAKPDKDTITTIRQGERVTVTRDGNDYTISGNPIRTVNTTADGKEPLVTLTPSASGDTLTLNSSRLAQEIAKVQGKTDNFVSGVGVSREGNKVKLTYTFVDGTSKEVEFEDKDTVALAYDDTALKARVSELEKVKYKDKDTTVYPYTIGEIVTLGKGNRVRQNEYKTYTYKITSSNKPLTEPFIENILQFDFQLYEKNSVTGETYGRPGTNFSITKVARQFEELYTEQTYALTNNTSLLVKLNTIWKDTDNKFTVELGLALIYKEQEGDFVREYRHDFTADEIDSGEQAHISVQVDGVEKGYSKLTLRNVAVGMSNFGYRVYKQVGDGAYTKLETINE